MNDSTTTQHSTELVYRRFTDPLSIFGWEPPYPDGLPGFWWGLILALVLGLAFFYVGWMYLKDSRGVGPIWASFLGVLRVCVYLVLALVFLLPGWRPVEEVTEQSRVFFLLDPTPSMGTRDDLPAPGQRFLDLPTRQDKVLNWLKDKDFRFLNQLVEKNPTTIQRFGTRLDDQFLYMTDSGAWTREEWEERQRELDPTKKKEGERLTLGYWTAWLKPDRKIDVNVVEAGTEDLKMVKDRLTKLAAANEKLDEAGVFKGTNVTQATLDTLTREMNKPVQGIIVVTDGRNTTSASIEGMLELEKRAKTAKIPIFVVGVGTNRPQVQIDVADLRAPKIIRPEDAFKAHIDVIGEGMADKPCNVVMDVARVHTTRDGKEELLPIILVEAENKTNKDGKKEQVTLPSRLTLQPVEPVPFDRSSPPRARLEFQFDAYALAKAANIDLTAEPYRGKKWEIAEGEHTGSKESDELILQGRIPADSREIFGGTPTKDIVARMPVAEKDRSKLEIIHVGEKTRVQVIRKPLEILLFASAALRDYQFVQALLVREMDKDRVKVSIFLQAPPGATERRTGIVQSVPPNRLLDGFPDKFDQPVEKEDDKLKDLSTYDVIMAFDPDWTQLSEKQLDNVLKWVERGGGLVVVGGPINTLQLARPGANKDKLKPILDLYPVVLKDIRIDDADRHPDRPWPLDFTGATPDMEFLKLSDEVDRGAQPFLSDWLEFWGRGKDNPDKTAAIRGIFNFYPVEIAKIGSLVIARFMDPQAKLKDGSQMPYIVASDPASNRRVVWIGSGEMWRLRQYKEAYHERFWTKLARYVGSSKVGKSTNRITPWIGRHFVAGRWVEFEAKIDGKGGVPYGAKQKPPEISIKVPAGINPIWRVTDKVMTALERDKIPEPVRTKLKELIGQEFDTKDLFERKLAGLLTAEERKQYEDQLVVAAAGPREVLEGLTMKPKAGSEGWFTGRFQVRTPGTFELEIHVPDTKDTSLPEKFIVTPSDPEMDNTRPDFDLMYRMASEADLVLPRMFEKDRQELRKRLTRPVLGEGNGADGKDGKETPESLGDDKMRLFFTLENADLIPSCMISDPKTATNRGPVKDQWDEGFTVYHNPPNPPVKISWVLLAAVGLLSVEWLTRKLLRLA
jgi:hypothetical protein